MKKSGFFDGVKADTKFQIGIPAVSIPPWSTVIPIPSLNPMMHSTLEITAYGGEGFRLELRDPAGTRVWVGYLGGDHTHD